MKKKTILSLILAVAMVATLFTGCGKKSESTEGDGAGSDEKITVSTSTEDLSDEIEGSAYQGLASMNAIEVTRLMGNGINLGNTMESGSRASLGTKAAMIAYETNWGQPVTTAEMIQGMKDEGFDCIRIPVAWTCGMDYESGDYTIREEFIARVAEIVNYALAADMFVIVNDHWDNQWWGMFGDADESVREQAWKIYEGMWTQIASYFADYDERLIFESANEELGNRLNDNWKNTSGDQTGVLTTDECYATVNEINQKFVDIMRSSGGYNARRFLLIAGYGTDITATCDSRYEMPKDTVDGKLIVSVHFYDPSNYCIFKSTSSWGLKQDYQTMNDTLAKMTQFTDAGYGVIIGEYGVLHDGVVTDDNLRDNAIAYTDNFLNNCDYYGYCPVLWDCNNYYSKSTCSIQNDEIHRLYSKHKFKMEEQYTEDEWKTKASNALKSALDSAVDVVTDPGTAWIMYSSSDWNVSYAVGDDHPAGGSDGIVATEVAITGAGTYTVGLDFTGTYSGYANSFVFSAIGILDGESLFPGYIITVTEIKINGEVYAMHGENYTTSDDSKCTRTNLYNGWVTAMPGAARTNGNLANADCVGVIDPDEVGAIKTLEVTFEFSEQN